MTDNTCPEYSWCSNHHETDHPEDNGCHGGVIATVSSGDSTADLYALIGGHKDEFSFDLNWELSISDLDSEMADLRSIVDQIESALRSFKLEVK